MQVGRGNRSFQCSCRSGRRRGRFRRYRLRAQGRHHHSHRRHLASHLTPIRPHSFNEKLSKANRQRRRRRRSIRRPSRDYCHLGGIRVSVPVSLLQFRLRLLRSLRKVGRLVSLRNRLDRMDRLRRLSRGTKGRLDRLRAWFIRPFEEVMRRRLSRYDRPACRPVLFLFPPFLLLPSHQSLILRLLNTSTISLLPPSNLVPLPPPQSQ